MPVRQDVIDGYHEALDHVEEAIKANKAKNGAVEAKLNETKRAIEKALGEATVERARDEWRNRPRSADG